MVSNVESDIVINGLIVELDAGNAKSYPGSGTVWTDLTKNGNNGTLSTITYTANNGGSLIFNGSTSYITLTSFLNKNVGTMSCWFMTNAWYNYNSIFSNGAGANDWELWGYADGTLRGRPNASGEGTVSSLSTVSNSIYHNIVLTWSEANGTKMYLDSVYQAAGTGGVYTVPGIVYLGGGAGNTTLNGNISYYSAYDRVLTQAEIFQNFNAQRGRYNV